MQGPPGSLLKEGAGDKQEPGRPRPGSRPVPLAGPWLAPRPRSPPILFSAPAPSLLSCRVAGNRL